MKIIKMIMTMAGPDAVRTAGQICRVDDATAANLIRLGVAQLAPGVVQPEADPETAALAGAPEAAVPATPRKKVKK